MAKDKTPKPKTPMVEDTTVTEPSAPVVDPLPEEEMFDDVPTVEENDLIESFENFEATHDDEVKPLSNREAARLLREKHQG